MSPPRQKRPAALHRLRLHFQETPMITLCGIPLSNYYNN